MKVSNLIAELEYWRDLVGGDPEVVVNMPPTSYEIDLIQPVRGICTGDKAIGIIFN